MTGSAGKTFSGPQSGIMVWDDAQLTGPLTHAVFPVLAATHQVNRVAALAVSAAEMIAYGKAYMAQIVRNAQALGAALANTKALPLPIKSLPMCASLAVDWKLRNGWREPTSSRTRT